MSRLAGICVALFVTAVVTVVSRSDLEALAEQVRSELPRPEPDVALLRAVFQLDVDEVRRLLDAGADPDAGNPPVDSEDFFVSPLCEAIQGRGDIVGPLPDERLKILRLLVAAGATGDGPCPRSTTPYSLAFYQDSRNAVRVMNDAGLHIGPNDTYRGYAELQAVRDKDAQLLDLLLSAGAPPSPGALDMAISYLQPDTVKRLIDAGVDVNAFPSAHGAVNWRSPDTTVLNHLLAAGADVNRRGHDGETPLARAARDTVDEAAFLLLAAGADKNTTFKDGTPLVFWLQGAPLKPEKTRILNALIEAGADPHLKPTSWNLDGRTPFVFAIERGDLELIKKFVAAGADVNKTSTSRRYIKCTERQSAPQPGGPVRIVRTGAPWFFHGCESEDVVPLVIAIDEEEIEIFDFLLESGADPNVLIGDRFTLLEYGARHRRGDVWVRKLLAVSVSPNVMLSSVIPVVAYGDDRNHDRPALWTPPDGESPDMPLLTAAALGGNKDLTSLLIEAGANVNAPATDGATALHCLAGAAQSFVDYRETARMLLDAGADLTLTDYAGYTPITLARSRKNLKMIELLLERDFDVNIPDGARRTVLGAAIEGTRDKFIVRRVLKKGARVGQREIELARATNFPSLIELVESSHKTEL